jgi:hypothetical protein
MLALRRVFFEGSFRPELVLLHYDVVPEGSPDRLLARSTLVVPPSGEPGRRETRIFLPSPPPAGRLLVRYFFSTVGNGAEWFSPVYEAAVPGEDVMDDLCHVEEKGPGNLPPAAGLGMFRIRLPLKWGEPGDGTVRYGFGAMRKKPSPDLCRAAYDMEGGAPVVEIPEALSVLKNRPMPYFLYHIAGDNGELAADKINCARITLQDDTGEVLCSRLLWSDPSWTVQNLSVMELKKIGIGAGRAADIYFARDRDAFLRERSVALDRHPLPRTFEAYVFGTEGSVVEYCFQVLLLRRDGSVVAGWRNRDGGNWQVTL